MHIHTYTLRSIKKAFPESQTKKYREAKNPTSFDTHPIIQLISVYTTCIRDFRRLCWPLRRRVVQRIARAHACTRIKGVCINKQAGEPSSRDLWREISFFFFFYFLFISLLDRREKESREVVRCSEEEEILRATLECASFFLFCFLRESFVIVKIFVSKILIGFWARITGLKKMYVCIYVWNQILSPAWLLNGWI